MVRPSLLPFLGGPVRCELLFTAPFSLLAGGLLGFHQAAALGLGRNLAAVGGGVGLTVLVAVQIAMEPLVVERLGGRDGRWGLLVAYLWDALTGAVVGFPLAVALGAPVVPGVGAALSAGAAYGFVMGHLVCGEGPAVVARALLGGTGIKRAPEHSRAQTLEAQGRWSEALAAYAAARLAHPRDPLPYLAQARILARRGDDQEALEVLGAARNRAGLSAQQEVLVLQRMTELCAELGCRERMAPELARYVDASPTAPGAAWARAELQDIKDEIARGLELPPPASDP